MKRKVRQRWPVEQLKSCTQQEWTGSSEKLQQLATSFPKRLKGVIKRVADVTHW